MPVGTPFGRRCSVNICSVCTPRFTDKAKSYQISSTALGWTNPSACAKSLCSQQNLAFSHWEKPHGHGESDRICATRLHRGAIWCVLDVHCSMRWVHLLRENHGLKFKSQERWLQSFGPSNVANFSMLFQSWKTSRHGRDQWRFEGDPTRNLRQTTLIWCVSLWLIVGCPGPTTLQHSRLHSDLEVQILVKNAVSPH